jgi:hypothetical protein
MIESTARFADTDKDISVRIGEPTPNPLAVPDKGK